MANHKSALGQLNFPWADKIGPKLSDNWLDYPLNYNPNTWLGGD